eukprot:2461400-Rhodomonas_salina.3
MRVATTKLRTRNFWHSLKLSCTAKLVLHPPDHPERVAVPEAGEVSGGVEVEPSRQRWRS